MKLEINANDFCPDDCPYVSILTQCKYEVDNESLDRYYECKNKDLCRYVHNLKIENKLKQLKAAAKKGSDDNAG